MKQNKTSKELILTLKISLVTLAIAFFLETISIALPLTPIPPIVMAALYAAAGLFLLRAVSKLK